MPLLVDLDGALLKSDMLVEHSFAFVGREPLQAFAILQWLWQGKAVLKDELARRVTADPAMLPYNEAVLAVLREAKQRGERLYITSASNIKIVKQIAAYLGLFDGVFGSSRDHNLKGEAKAARLVAEFGEGGFDYIGHDRADLAVWKHARKAYIVGRPKAVLARLDSSKPDRIVIPAGPMSLRDATKPLRLHQWAKNVLVFVPLLTAHLFDAISVLMAIIGFLAFSLSASGVYMINDLTDLESDRSHPTKKNRPFASGRFPIHRGLMLVPLLLCAALGLALVAGPWFLVVLMVYLVLTTCYTFFLKRKMIVDVVTLAVLYTIRILGGAAAIAVAPSQWIVMFSLFIFTALALVKRYSELAVRLDNGLDDPTNRNYKIGDLPVVSALAAASAFNAVTVFALYLSSEQAAQLYRRPFILWFACPLLIYWLARLVLMSHRRLVHDDPIVFAMKDWNSLVAAGCLIAIVLAAI
jgi:4-hydroxybenzoate polyprenyltransferase